MPEASNVIETGVGILLPLIIAGLGYLAYNKPDEYLVALRRLSLLFFVSLAIFSVYFFTTSWYELNQLVEIAPDNLKDRIVSFKEETENKIIWISLLAAAPFIGIEVGSWIREIRRENGD